MKRRFKDCLSIRFAKIKQFLELKYQMNIGYGIINEEYRVLKKGVLLCLK